MKKHNFSAGPCILPQEVFKQAADAVLNFNNSNLSILEISHRSKEFVAVIEEARSLVLELMELDSSKYTTLFLQGGASMEFLRVPQNFLNQDTTAAYLDTGTWAIGAAKVAKEFGNVKLIASSKDKNYSYIPKQYAVPENAAYLHFTTNNTIFGTQFKSLPKTDVPLVCDMSSDIFSRKIEFDKFDLIYAGAQKNMGPAGVTLVVIKNTFLATAKENIPAILGYKNHVNKDSMYNTPPVFAVYTSLLNLRWLKNNGGITAIESKNEEKANLLYSEIDRNSLFEGVVNKSDRSNMNATFVLKDETNKDAFDKLCKEAGINGLNGHRSVGGYRASMYNAMEIESVQVLVNQMQKLENTTTI